jgi:hypothetical protein
VLLVDCDASRSTLDWRQGTGEAIPQNLSDDQALETLRQLRQAQGYHLVASISLAREREPSKQSGGRSVDSATGGSVWMWRLWGQLPSTSLV